MITENEVLTSILLGDLGSSEPQQHTPLCGVETLGLVAADDPTETGRLIK